LIREGNLLNSAILLGKKEPNKKNPDRHSQRLKLSVLNMTSNVMQKMNFLYLV
jgi:hypothetical protein